jgi:Bacterial protein of unknown function (DUF882)
MTLASHLAPLLLAAIPMVAPEASDGTGVGHAGVEVDIDGTPASLLPPPGQGLMDLTTERPEHNLPPLTRERTKKEAWLAEKAVRLDIHLTEKDLARTARERAVATRRRPSSSNQQPVTAEVPLPPPATRIAPVTTLFNLRTRETLALLPGLPPQERFHNFLRDHYTNQATRMDERLVDVLARVATKFGAERVEVVSGYRSPKYNLILRKKGREVARQSQHTEGNAVDFRVRGVTTKRLLNYVRSLRIGGVGYYPHSQFVHSDTGRVRFWRGS